MPTRKLSTKLMQTVGAVCLLATAQVSNAAISSYSDDFQGYGAATLFTPWEGFSDNCGFPGGYSFGPSTSGPQITALANDGAGNDYLNFYANYDNGTCQSGAGPNPVENISVFINQSFTGADTASGDTWIFTFDYREADSPFNPAGNTEVGAFIRVFDGAFNLLATDTLDTSGSQLWQTGQLQITLDSGWTEGFFQIGFNNAVSGFDSSGMYYDNVNLNVVPIPAAVWLFASGLGMLGWVRRRAQQ